MMANATEGGRLNFWRAAYVVARRDFTAILLSRAFIFFLLGPLFPLLVALMAGGIGAQMQSRTAGADIGIAMAGPDVDAMLAARAELAGQLGPSIPRMVEMARLDDGQPYDAAAVLEQGDSSIAAIVTGTPQQPQLTGTGNGLIRWEGTIGLIAARAQAAAPVDYPPVTTFAVAASGATDTRDRMRTAQSAQVLLFLLIMLLAGMVLSNLVEEKGNKIIEILAAAIPMDAVFLGKLAAMLAISLVGICVWGSAAGIAMMAGGAPLSSIAEPGVGWPVFLGLGALYFAMGYLLLGSIFLAIGSLAATVREVQTLSMPVTMAQVLVFFLATLAAAQPGGWIELAAIAFPLSSPFTMLARAAADEALWPHVLALAWQALCVAIFIKAGSTLFRKKVMKSGGSGAFGSRRGLKQLMLAVFSRGSDKPV